VQSHPELSGIFPINSEGNIQYEFAGVVALGGMNKQSAEDKIRKIVSQYVNEPKLYLKIAEYHSKAVYVMGQVTRPGKYYMRSETLPVREAIIEAGLPLFGSAMHRARLITPGKNSEAVTKIVDLNALLYKGDSQYNFEMRSGDQLYVPSTQEEYLQTKSENGLDLNKSDATNLYSEDVRYTLGPDDVIGITIQRHPEFSGKYPVNLEGKIQMDIIGDIEVTGLTKKELERKLGKLLSNNVEVSDISVIILEYRSKAVYVMGQVTKPGKYYMRSETLPVREAIIQAGLPLSDSAMQRARLIIPSKDNKAVAPKIVDLNALLYKGDLQYDFEMRSGDQLYVPSTQEVYVQEKSENSLVLSQVGAEKTPHSEDVRYTLGPDDVIEIIVQRHPEFSGRYPVNLEGKIQMDIIGDIEVTGLTKKELERKLDKLLGSNVEVSDISVIILEYRSKVYYVIGEVGRPGKFFMRTDSISVREAAIEAGLPTYAAAMRKCRLITPSKDRKVITKKVDLYSVLYYGKLKKNLEMRPGDFLYVPATIMSKIFRVIAPITAPVTSAAETQTGISTLRTLPTTTSSSAR
jgi:polysaccharide export outer membrane protein